jgi:ATP-dependent protease HslVU (ClpYQ) peptidase subunit
LKIFGNASGATADFETFQLFTGLDEQCESSNFSLLKECFAMCNEGAAARAVSVDGVGK